MGAAKMRLTAAMLATSILAGGLGCGKRGDVEIPVYPLPLDTESETMSETETEFGIDECPDVYVDSNGNCIRYVNWQSDSPECGLTWNTAYTTIQDGIDAAYAAALQLGYCEVWVASGVYRSYETGPLDSIRLKPNVAVFGGFAGNEEWLDDRDIQANETVIDGLEEGGEGRSYHVVMGADNSALDGFTVTGGRADGDAPHHRGGGIYINACDTSIANCTIIGNEAVDGGGVFAYDGWPVVEQTEISGNTATHGGGIFVLNGFAHLSNVRFVENQASISGGGLFLERVYAACYVDLTDIEFISNSADEDGGAMYNISCNPMVDYSLFESNLAGGNGGAIATYRGSFDLANSFLEDNRAVLDGGGFYGKFSDTAISYTEIAGNMAQRDAGGVYCELTDTEIYSSTFLFNLAAEDGGAITVYFDEPNFVNTLLTGNQANRGAGIFNGTRAETEIVNCTLHGNQAFEMGGGLYNAQLAEPEVYNSVLWENHPKEIFDEIGSEATVSYSDIRDGYPGLLNIDSDPVFAGPGRWDDNDTPLEESDDFWVEGDYHLLPISPCIDVAYDAISPTQDAEGKTWADTENKGLPDVVVDMGIFDFQVE